jgi:predicted transcriptional regulator YdeE
LALSIGDLVAGFFAHDIRRVEPHVVVLDRPICVLGMGIETSVRSIAGDAARLGRRLREYKRSHTVPHRVEPWGFAAVSLGFNREAGTFLYLIGDVVSSLDEIPEGLIGFEIPEGKYAVFPIRPKNRLGWPIAITRAKKHIYEDWLPRSGFRPAGGIDDFEYHDDRSARGKDPEIDLYVALAAPC